MLLWVLTELDAGGRGGRHPLLTAGLACPQPRTDVIQMGKGNHVDEFAESGRDTTVALTPLTERSYGVREQCAHCEQRTGTDFELGLWPPPCEVSFSGLAGYPSLQCRLTAHDTERCC